MFRKIEKSLPSRHCQGVIDFINIDSRLSMTIFPAGGSPLELRERQMIKSICIMRGTKVQQGHLPAENTPVLS